MYEASEILIFLEQVTYHHEPDPQARKSFSGGCHVSPSATFDLWDKSVDITKPHSRTPPITEGGAIMTFDV